MNVKIQAIHFEIADRLTEFANKKAAKLERRFPEISSFEITFTLIKPETAMNKEALVCIRQPQQPEFVATKKADTFEEALDQAIAALEKPLEKAKARK